MRSAAATFDDDIGAASPTRRKAARRSRPAAGRGKAKGGFFRANNVARIAAIGMSVTIGAGILVNALLMQKGRHPAPLFSKVDPPPAPAAIAAAPDVPPAAAPMRAAPPQPNEALAAAVKLKRPVAPAQDDAGDDPIGRLLKGGSPAVPAEKGDRTILGVQKALGKLGFAVKANGTMGASTRKAIEAYEKVHKLPVKGEVDRRLVKSLAADSGVHIE